MPGLETVEVVLVHCNLVNNSYQQAPKVLFTFVPNKEFGQLIIITPSSPAMLKRTNAKFSFTEIWFTDQNNRPLEVADKITLVGKSKNKEKKDESNEVEEIYIPPE